MSSVSVTVTGRTGVDINVGAGTGFAASVPSLLVLAGANITVATTSGSFTIIGRDVPVQSVQGRTGAITVTRADLTAAAATHTHSFSDIVGLTSVANVVSVAGRTGVVTLSASDVSAASSTHAHNYVQSLNALTGTPSIVAGSNVTVTTGANSITVAAGGNVTSVNGQTGTVVLTSGSVSAASSTHAHNYVQSLNALTGTPSIVAGSNVTVTTGANSITIAAGGGGGSVTSVNGQTGTVVLTSSEVSAASSTHAHNYVQSLNGQTGSVSVVAGSNISLSTAAGSITINGSTAQSLVIGTVTDGTAAAATITGSPPALNLTLPAGPTGTFGTPQDINAQTGDYTLVLADAGKMVTVNASNTAVTITVPTNGAVSFPIGTHIDIARLNANSVTINGDTGVAVNATPGRKLRANYSTGTLIKLGTNSWLLVGDLSA